MSAHSSSLSDFDIFANELVKLGSSCSPSLIQGWITGYLTTTGRLTVDQWMNEAAFLIEPQAEWEDAQKAMLLKLYDQALDDLQDGDMPYQFLIPDYTDGAQARLQGIIEWCEGFVTGFGSSGIIKQQDLDEEMVEMLEDLIAITQAELDPDDEANEEMIDQVVDHSKVTAYGLFYQFNTPPAPESGEESNSPLH